jgi:CheY-like chemotaxis protein
MKILAVDDKPINNKVIELDVEEYLEDNDIEDYSFVEKSNGQEALAIIIENEIDIVFMDIMMPIMDGIEAVKQIRAYGSDIKQPMIIMVTALNDEEMKQKAKDAGANSYIAKPFCNREISEVMKFCIEELKNLETSDIDIEDDFLDFDDFDDFDDELDTNDSTISTQKEMMNDFNKSHKQLSAKEFLKDYPDLEYIIEDLEDVESDIEEYLDVLYEGNLNIKITSIIATLTQYSRFLNGFTEFQEPSIALVLLTRILEDTNFELIEDNNNHLISEYIKSILTDLIQWKNHVFVEQDAVDVFYINASLLNSCIQLETILKQSVSED